MYSVVTESGKKCILAIMTVILKGRLSSLCMENTALRVSQDNTALGSPRAAFVSQYALLCCISVHNLYWCFFD